MATIKSFKALISDPEWFEALSANGGEELSSLKDKLEARGPEGIGTARSAAIPAFIEELLSEEKFYTQQPGLYLYEQQSSSGNFIGIWALTAVSDFLEGKIITHEQVISERSKRIMHYREDIGLEGSPILLAYRSHSGIDQIISRTMLSENFMSYSQPDCSHRIWCIAQTDCEQLTILFKALDNVYVGDGHHRLAAAASMEKDVPQYLMSLYVSTNQIRISTFNRVIKPGSILSRGNLMMELKKMFFISEVPFNVPYQPDRLHRFGFCMNRRWFQLDLKAELHHLQQLTDVEILQHAILSPHMDIKDPTTDSRLQYLAANDFSSLKQCLENDAEVIVFTLHHLSIHKFIEQSEKQLPLPPKSTYIEPKVPYGMLLHPNKSFSFELHSDPI